EGLKKRGLEGWIGCGSDRGIRYLNLFPDRCTIMVADEFVPLVVSREGTGIDGKEEWANAHFLFALKCAGLVLRQAHWKMLQQARQAHPEKSYGSSVGRNS